MLVADKNGVVVQSTLPGAVGRSVADTGYFRAALAHPGPQKEAYIGDVLFDPALHIWCMQVARWVHRPDGTFAGVVVADWRVGAITRLFDLAHLGHRPIVELVGLRDGKLLAIAGVPSASPGQAVADSMMFLRLQAAPDGTWIGPTEPDRISRFNAFRRIPGSDLAVVVGMEYSDALALSIAWQHQAELFAGCITVLILAMAGTLLWTAREAAEQRTVLAKDRRVLAAANAQLNVAKHQADAKTAQLEATLEGISDGVATVDAQLRLVEWNRHFAEVAGVPRHMLRVGLPMEDMLRAQAKAGQFGPVDVEAEVARRMERLRSGDLTTTTERERPDGHVIELRRNPLPDGGFVTVYSDVSTRKQVENALRAGRAIAEAATEAKSRFVAIVSHEIRTPLNALLATLTLLQDSGLPAPQRALLDMARQSGDALLGLINDILEMARMEAGQLSLRHSVFSLRTLLEGVVEIFRLQATERGIVIGLAASPDVPQEMYTDPGRLRQVLINLVSNAVKFGQPGLVAMLAAREQTPDGEQVLYIAVRDRGPVIEPEGRARLFRPFSRLEGGDPTAEEPLGSGLGLAICRQLVTLMGGAIGCDPWMAEDGQSGNEFWVRLPISSLPETQAPRLRQGQPARRILPRTRILLVEDILANQLVTATLLRREGHLVDIASNGTEALRAVAELPYDFVFMDIFMPGMNGFETARRIRRLPPPAGTVPIAALTANISPDDQAACREAGINRLLGKPISLPELVQALAELTWHGLPERTVELRAPPPLPRGAVLSADRIHELRSSLPGDMLNGMVEECLIDLQARLPTLRRSVEAGRRNEVVSEAHAMIGMAAGYGMAALEARLRALMAAARADEAAQVAVLASELDAELRMAATALHEALAIEML